MRIAIVNDTPLAIDTLKLILSSAPEHEIAWIAEDGQQAIDLAKKDIPELILMDIYMPEVDGVEATSKIMQQSPCAILVVTSNVDDHSGRVFDAMGAGAVDAVNTPVLVGSTDENSVEAFLRKITTIKNLIDPAISYSNSNNTSMTPQNKTHKNVLVIGASTGGPNALATILSELPVYFPIPVVVVQHVDAQFVEGLRDWLDIQIGLPVELINEGDRLKPGIVHLSNSGQHLSINSVGVFQYSDEPSHYVHKPSVNVLFESVAKNWNGNAVGVLLTGMGKDGAAGLLSMRDHGFCTLAQDEESCAVYGMPKAAVELDAVEVILPLNEISKAICQHYGFGENNQVKINE